MGTIVWPCACTRVGVGKCAPGVPLQRFHVFTVNVQGLTVSAAGALPPGVGKFRQLGAVVAWVAAPGRRKRRRVAAPQMPGATSCNTTDVSACRLFQRLRTRLDAAGLPSQWLDERPQGSDAKAPMYAANGRTQPPPRPPPPPVLSRLALSPPPPPPRKDPDDKRLEPCVPPSGGLQSALEQEAARSRELLSRLGAHACDGVGDACRQLGDATPASPAVCPLSGTCPPSAGAAGVAASAPRIFAYDCMDGVHAQLLAQPHVTEFFDANLPRNQFISEVALHRSLLASPYRTLRPERADFFYIPFYSRLAYADRKATRAQRALALNATASLAACLRASPWWRRASGRVSPSPNPIPNPNPNPNPSPSPNPNPNPNPNPPLGALWAAASDGGVGGVGGGDVGVAEQPALLLDAHAQHRAPLRVRHLAVAVGVDLREDRLEQRDVHAHAQEREAAVQLVKGQGEG